MTWVGGLIYNQNYLKNINEFRQLDSYQSSEIKSYHNQIISVGDTQVGKSCLIKRYCEGRFVPKYITTIGVDYGVKKM